MNSLDDDFLASLGLAGLSPSDRADLLAATHSELELRVGTILSQGLSDHELALFESFIDRDVSAAGRWLELNEPDFEQQAQFQQFVAKASSTAGDREIICDYASIRWLEHNRPNYKRVVAEVLDELKANLVASRTDILNSVGVTSEH